MIILPVPSAVVVAHLGGLSLLFYELLREQTAALVPKMWWFLWSAVAGGLRWQGLAAISAEQSPGKGFEGGLEGVPVEAHSKHEKNSNCNTPPQKKTPPPHRKICWMTRPRLYIDRKILAAGL